MKGDAVSVVIPTYNRAAMIGRALDSVLPQCRPGDEVIVVDDGSTDDTEARLKEWSGRIVYHKTPNGGVSKARNAGMEKAKNSLVAFLDSDDEWLPGKLDLQRALLDARPDILLCFTDLRSLYPSGAVQHSMLRYYAQRDFTEGYLGPRTPYSSLAPLPPGSADVPVHVGDLYSAQLDYEAVQIGTLMFRRAALADPAVRFPLDRHVSEDTEFVARLARRGPAAYLDAETEVFHQHASDRLTDTGPLVFNDARLKLIARVWGADAEFLDAHGERYRKAVQRLRLQRVRILLGDGRPREAREALRAVEDPPAFYRALCLIPGPLLAAAARLKYPER